MHALIPWSPHAAGDPASVSVSIGTTQPPPPRSPTSVSVLSTIPSLLVAKASVELPAPAEGHWWYFPRGGLEADPGSFRLNCRILTQEGIYHWQQVPFRCLFFLHHAVEFALRFCHSPLQQATFFFGELRIHHLRGSQLVLQLANLPGETRDGQRSGQALPETLIAHRIPAQCRQGFECRARQGLSWERQFGEHSVGRRAPRRQTGGGIGQRTSSRVAEGLIP
jgi:hypothetical protein